MKYLFKTTILFVLIFLVSNLSAQQNLTLYNMHSIPQSMSENPSVIPYTRVNIGFPVFSSTQFNYGNTGFKLNYLITKTKTDSTNIDFNNVLNHLHKNNYILTSFQTDLFSFGFKNKQNYFSLNMAQKMNFNIRYPKAMFNLFVKGNGDPELLGKTQTIDFGLEASNYTEYALGYVREVKEDKLSVGGKFKFLKGQENFTTKKSDLQLLTDVNTFDLTFKSNILINTSGVTDLKDIDPLALLLKSKNTGLGFDLGANYKYSKKISLNASLIDLGYINWKENTKTIKSKNPDGSFTFEGLDLTEFVYGSPSVDSMVKNIGDTLLSRFALDTAQSEKYRTSLPTKVYIGGNYFFSERNFASALLYSQFYDKKFHPGMAVAYNAAYKNWLYGSLSCAYYNRSLNLGLGTSAKAGPFNFYVVSDNAITTLILNKYILPEPISAGKKSIKSVPFPGSSKNFGVRFGVNLTFGAKPRVLDHDHDGTPDKEDNCPKLPGTIATHGCPDKDGDHVEDSKDECPDVAGKTALKGCPDSDNDGVADKDDKCPKVAGEIAFGGCPDTDKDGVTDAEDNCPENAGPLYTHGCPDSDGDSIIDLKDKCPKLAGNKLHDGCPDTDKDGVFDNDDKCPDKLGPKENNGCPYTDTDGDGVLDNEDRCKDTKGPKDNHGCPYGDADKDGLTDNLDSCPNTFGPKDNHGCPVIEKVDQEVINTAFSNLEFEANKAILLTEKSDTSLSRLAVMMIKKPNYKIRLSGHTDDVGSDEFNLDLSRRRAETVKNYLVNKGVDPSRIQTEYFGETRPLVPNINEANRQKNRRVEMKILFD